MGRLRNRLAHHSLTIFCLPPLATVMSNVGDGEDDMPGVGENIHRIYQQYQMQHLMWPGKSVTFDYTQQEASWEALRYALSDSRDKLWKEHL